MVDHFSLTLHPTNPMDHIMYLLKNVFEEAEKLYKCVQGHTTQADWTPDKTLAMWAVIDENGMVDIDKVYSAIKDKAVGRWPVEIAGLKASEADLDKLYTYIKEA